MKNNDRLKNNLKTISYLSLNCHLIYPHRCKNTYRTLSAPRRKKIVIFIKQEAQNWHVFDWTPQVRDQQKSVEEVWFGSITWVYPSLVLYKKWIKIPFSPAPFFLKTT